MQHTGRRPGTGGSPDARPRAGPTDADEPAIRDATDILARAEADRSEADRARARFAAEPLPALEPDAQVAPLIEPGEIVVAERRSAVLDRRQNRSGTEASAGLGGRLYVTSRRLILVGRLTLSFDLAGITEVMLSGERLLVVSRDGGGFSLDVARPRLLRVEIAAARSAAAV